MSPPTFAFITLGRLHVFRDGKLTDVSSTFGANIRQRALEIERRHEWKQNGAGARFMGMWGPRSSGNAADIPIAISSLTSGGENGGVLYTLETPDICALLQRNGDDEERLWHSNQTRIRDLARHATESRIVCSVWDSNGTANLGVMNANGSHLREFTEGDSLDLAPSWAGSNSVVYQSAGLGRTRDGYAASYGPFEVHRLDFESGEMETLASDRRFDFLAPQMTADGTLYCIRRPHRDQWHRPWWRSLLDLVLIPWRLLTAIFHFFNFFSMRYSGKPLAQGGQASKEADLKRMMLWGNMIEAEQEMRKKPQEEAPDLVPRTWELIRIAPNGDTSVLAGSVLSFDMKPDGAILYTNGSAIFSLGQDGKSERILKHSYIEKLVAFRG